MQNPIAHSKDFRWIYFAAYYILALSAITLIKVPFMQSEPEDYLRDAYYMPWYTFLFGALGMYAGVALVQYRLWGRELFLLVAPWLSIGIASMYASILWQEDIPYSALLIFPYLILAFFLSRKQEMNRLKYPSVGTQQRIGVLSLGFVIVLIVGFLWIQRPADTGGELQETLHALNEYTKWVVIRMTILAHYGGAIGVIFLHFLRKK